MITRVVGDVIDAVLLAVRMATRGRGRVAAAWRAVPGDAMGRAVLAACGVPAEGTRIVVPGAGEAVLVADARLAKYLDEAPLRPYAQTLGGYVLSREPLPPAIVRHELVHVRQWARLGPLYLPAYGAASLRAMLAGGDRYRDNAFEVAARAAEPEQAA